MSTPRHHHWVPQSYLARFTEKGHKKSQLHVIDLAQRRTYRTVPRNVCGERDFNKIISPDLPSDALETSLNRFETQADRALTEVIKNSRGFSSEAWLWALNFMALLATRNPLMRTRAEHFYRERVLQQLDSATDTPEKFAAVVHAAKATGDIDKGATVDFERHRAFLRERKFKLTFDPGFHVVGEFDTLDAVLKQLVKRRWLLLEAPADSGGFITTDHPVTLCHADGSGPEVDRPLGFATPDTLLLFALSPQLLAVGTFNGRDGITGATRKLVAKANCTLVRYCNQLVLAPHDHFEVQVPISSEYIVGAQVLDVFKYRVNVDGDE